MSDDFRATDAPGFRLSTSDEDGKQSSEEYAFLHCMMRDYLDLDYVEACAIFKDEEERILECRYEIGTYEAYPLTERSKQEDRILILCGDESLHEAE